MLTQLHDTWIQYEAKSHTHTHIAHPCMIIDLFYFPTLIFYLIFYRSKKEKKGFKQKEEGRKLNGD